MLVAWADIVVLVGGVPVTGIVGVEYSDEQEIVNKWGAGRHPVGRAKGRITPAAKLILYQEEVQALQAQSPNGRLQDLPPIEIQVSYLPDSGIVVTDKSGTAIYQATPVSGKRATPGRRWSLCWFPHI